MVNLKLIMVDTGTRIDGFPFIMDPKNPGNYFILGKPSLPLLFAVELEYFQMAKYLTQTGLIDCIQKADLGWDINFIEPLMGENDLIMEVKQELREEKCWPRPVIIPSGSVGEYENLFLILFVSETKPVEIKQANESVRFVTSFHHRFISYTGLTKDNYTSYYLCEETGSLVAKLEDTDIRISFEGENMIGNSI
jgi:hypothetical protein